MNILGISCFYHDSAAALVKDGLLTAAAAEERFSGIKHDSDFPRQAIEFCLEKGNLRINDIDGIVFYEKPFRKFDRILQSYLQTVPKSYPAFRKAIPVWLREKLWMPLIIKRKLHYDGDILFIDHHLSHAASAYYCSPFEQSAILTIDGVGEWATASIGIGDGNKIELVKEMDYPHSLGLLYSTFTYFLGFQVNSAEYKVMGLAPYGKPVYADLIKNDLIQIFDDGSIKLNMHYFDYHYGLKMTGGRFEKLFGREKREPETDLTEDDNNIAASIQEVTNEIILKMAAYSKDVTSQKNLCLAGGVALNCVSVGEIHKSGLFEKIYIQPASSDAGGAVGAALYTHHSLTDDSKKNNQPYFGLGPSFDSTYIEQFLRSNNIPLQTIVDDLAKFIANQISEEKIVALFNGAMEFGPRALGFRSILADPRKDKMKDKVNQSVKFRESFRPFAPVVLFKKANDYFEDAVESPYMLINFDVRESVRSTIPAVTHVDGTARIQTVKSEDNLLLYNILLEFEKITGVAVLLNTSLNLRGRPIVLTPEDAFGTFVSSGIDILILQDIVIEKAKIDSDLFDKFKIVSQLD